MGAGLRTCCRKRRARGERARGPWREHAEPREDREEQAHEPSARPAGVDREPADDVARLGRPGDAAGVVGVGVVVVGALAVEVGVGVVDVAVVEGVLAVEGGHALAPRELPHVGAARGCGH